MKQEITYIIYLVLGFLLLFVIAEALYHKAKVKAENTRKFVHISSGFIALLFPYLLSNHWQVLGICTLFFTILFFSIQLGLLPSINAVNRVTRGSLLFPVAVYMCYLAFDLTGHDLKFFYIPILILSVSDTLAAIAGKTWPLGKFRIRKHTKTLMGSLMFLLSAFLISILILNISEAGIFFQSQNLIKATLIASSTTIVEALCYKGYDNITIPGITILSLIFIEYSIL